MNAFIHHRSVYRSVYFKPKLGSSGSAHIWDQGSRGGWAGSLLDPEGSRKASEKVQEVAEGPESSPLKASTFISSLTSHPRCFSMHNFTMWASLKLRSSGQCQRFHCACEMEMNFMFWCPVSNLAVHTIYSDILFPTVGSSEHDDRDESLKNNAYSNGLKLRQSI